MIRPSLTWIARQIDWQIERDIRKVSGRGDWRVLGGDEEKREDVGKDTEERERRDERR